MTQPNPLVPSQEAREAAADLVLKLFNGGLVQVPDDSPRGYTTYFRPREAMQNALHEVEQAIRKDEAERAWRDGFDCARQCLPDDEAFCLTEDVEADAWADSKTAAALRARHAGDGA